jgi:hypothetical protein
MKSQLAHIWSRASIALVLVQLAACNSAAPLEQEGGGKPDRNPFLHAGSGYFSAFLKASRTVMTHPHIRQVTDAADIALWHEDSASSIGGGMVTLNGMPVELMTYPNGSSYHNGYNARYDNVSRVPLRLDGSYHVFDVGGNSYFGPIRDSLRSPTSEVNISSPLVTDTISRSEGVTVRWTPGNAQTAYILLIDTVKAEHYVFGKAVPDNGEYTIDPADIQHLAPGPVILSVAHGNHKEGVTSDGRTYHIVVHATEDLRMHMNP